MSDYSGRTLEFNNNRVEFPEPIGEVVEIDDGFIVQFQTAGKEDAYDEKKDSRNVWKIGSDGAVQWRIERADPYDGEYDPFTGLWKEDGEIWAYNFNGLAYQVDPENGELGETRQMK